MVATAGCAGVKVNTVDNRDYLALRRGDVLTSGQLSAAARTALQVAGVEEKRCSEAPQACREQVRLSPGLGEEQRLSTLSELWLQEAQDTHSRLTAEGRTDAFLESARYAYAYLFMTARTPSQRALEDRQSQVRDYYNFSVQQALSELFERYRGRPPRTEDHQGNYRLQAGRWTVFGRMEHVRLANQRGLPQALIPASSLSFAGLRNQYRRDGVGAELVAVTAKKVVNSDSDDQAWSETPFPAVTAVARFPGQTLDQVLATREVEVLAYDPYRQDSVELGGIEAPLAANFTSGYGLWLARSGFARQSLLTLVGRGDVLKTPHLYLLQPYDPNRHVVIMLHGLASSPEAWINVANEVLGDENLRRNYQVWQVYYPTNLPLALNNATIRRVIEQTLRHFDPEQTARASHDVVLVGHSMGGVLSRLMVSTSGTGVWDTLLAKYNMNGQQLAAAHKDLDPYLTFSPLPQVSRAIFIAAPHRGTPFAENRISRWAAGLVQLPASVLDRFKQLAQLLVVPGSASSAAMARPLNSIDNLSDRDPFVRAVADLPISSQVRYHSIIGNYTPSLALALSNDGVVPYSSSHLAGAQSEKVVPSSHSVQNTPEAIIEIRRILQLHLKGLDEPAGSHP
ncbi:alpha/beta fold hydrolase [Pseudomonas sp. C2L12B]|uniref:Alpha/beta fold hydrolase n=2 Tax=Pseudomonas typographi TaxID=2715964 RepID=A0ABR7YWL6_9PSED|nr:alpha/beta fold hydrolase [Pseudomonas typographi]MBD1585535.1 alpha/beta fold hydrolase [Pseudomonas typographi]MBD1597550.1 alpha/beta fold hydrolase [Pseudomonas typographi]